MSNNARVALMMAQGTEECEALIVVDVLRRAQIEVDIVAAQEDVHIVSSHNVAITCDTTFDTCDIDGYDMIVLPGGIPGTPNLHAHIGLMEAIKRFYDQGKWIAAICAAPSIFAEEGLLKGVQATSNPGFQQILRDKGALVQENQASVVDGKIITSQGMGTALDFAFDIVSVLDSKVDLLVLRKQVVDLRY